MSDLIDMQQLKEKLAKDKKDFFKDYAGVPIDQMNKVFMDEMRSTPLSVLEKMHRNIDSLLQSRYKDKQQILEWMRGKSFQLANMSQGSIAFISKSTCPFIVDLKEDKYEIYSYLQKDDISALRYLAINVYDVRDARALEEEFGIIYTIDDRNIEYAKSYVDILNTVLNRPSAIG